MDDDIYGQLIRTSFGSELSAITIIIVLINYEDRNKDELIYFIIKITFGGRE